MDSKLDCIVVYNVFVPSFVVNLEWIGFTVYSDKHLVKFTVI